VAHRVEARGASAPTSPSARPAAPRLVPLATSDTDETKTEARGAEVAAETASRTASSAAGADKEAALSPERRSVAASTSLEGRVAVMSSWMVTSDR